VSSSVSGGLGSGGRLACQNAILPNNTERSCSAVLKRFGAEMRFEVLAEDRLTREVPSLLRAIVNGRDWLDRILT
jgi:hypothetical protein